MLTLVAGFPFDEGNGLNVADISGNNNQGAISGAAWTTAGKFGNALTFDGINDWVTINDASSLDLTNGMTLEAWVFPTAERLWSTVLMKEAGSASAYGLYGAGDAGQPIGFVNPGSGEQNALGSAAPMNAWSHLASTYDGTTLRVYVNGVLAGSRAVGGQILTSLGPLRIGGNNVWPTEDFQGRIDEIRVYNHALSQAEIQTDMNTPVGVAPPDTTPPQVTSVTPLMGAVNVTASVNLTMQFNESMNAATINSSTIELRNPSGQLVPAAVTYNAGTNTATLNPTANLTSSTDYFTARVKSGGSGVKDAVGNPLAADFTWSFVTATPVFQESTVFSGLVNPTSVRFAPDGRVFVAEKSGLIKVFDNLSDSTPVIFADLRTKVHNYWDRGLLSMALHPDFPTTPYLYILYTHDAPIGGTAPAWGSPGGTSDPGPGTSGNGPAVSGRLSRLTVGPGNTWNGNELVLIEDWANQYPSHSVGTVAFGPDGALYASAGEGASFTFVDFGQNNLLGDPPQQGGALRSQDLRSSGDPVTLDGTVIRVDPNTGAAMPNNPLIGNSDVNARRIIASGMRNPFRFAFRPGTDEIWLGDVGMDNWEEINRIVSPTDAVLDNLGWPAYEGNGPHPGYDSANLPLLESLYAAGPAAHTGPYFTYSHSAQVVPGSGEPTGSSSISGLAFAQGGNLPAGFDGALLFADYSRDTIWVMYRGVNGLPDPSNRAAFVRPATGPVHLEIGPDGSLYYADLGGGTIRRVRYVAANNLPTAVAVAAPTLGTPPLTVSFNGTSSSDPDPSDILTYAWDLDGDGQFDDSTSPTPSFVYTGAGSYTAGLQVTDSKGATDTDTVVITVGTPPTAIIDAPLAGATWSVGDTIAFVGRGTDAEDGNLAASSMTWSLILHHGTHTHPLQDFVGVASGSFTAPDHDYPSHLELRLTVIDSQGLTDTEVMLLQPQTASLTFESSPSGLQVTVNGTTNATPFTKIGIVGSTLTIGTPSPQTSGSNTYQFDSWSDGGAQSHEITTPAVAATYTATFTAIAAPTGLAAAYGFNEGTGTVVGDASGNNNQGTIAGGAAWTTAGRFGNALTFDGINDWVTVNDAASLDLTSGMTLEAWVFPTAARTWSTVLMKETASASAYGLYAADGTGLSINFVNPGGGEQNSMGTALPLNTWSHVAGTYDGTTLRMYINGVLAGSRTVGAPIITSSGPMRIGGNNIWNTQDFLGRIDEIRVYNRPLSQAEIQTDMNTAIGGAPPPDTTPPTVTISSPTAGASVTGTVTVSASASDNIGVGGVQFLLNGADLGAEDTSAPYSISWNTATVVNGSYTLTARARDSAGNQTTSPGITVTVSNAAASGPVLALSFNEGTGTVVGDASGNNNQGTIAGGAAWTTAGRFGNALTFDGINDWVTVNDAASLDLTSGMTMEAWVFPTAARTWSTVLMKEAAPASAYGLYAADGAGLPISFVNPGGGEQSAAGGALPLNVWSHLAGTYDGTTLRTYVNGVLAGSLVVGGSIVNSSGALRIGGNSVWPTEDFQGRIDEIRVYNRPLSQAEIQTDLNTAIGGGALRAVGGVNTQNLGGKRLNVELVAPLMNEARAQWQALGASAEQLNDLMQLRVEVVDLLGDQIGYLSQGTIWLDVNAAGWGWFIDTTPWEDSEFDPNRYERPGLGRMDLLTVLAHEMGHALGFEHSDANDLMAEALAVGTRRVGNSPRAAASDAFWISLEQESQRGTGCQARTDGVRVVRRNDSLQRAVVLQGRQKT